MFVKRKSYCDSYFAVFSYSHHVGFRLFEANMFVFRLLRQSDSRPGPGCMVSNPDQVCSSPVCIFCDDVKFTLKRAKAFFTNKGVPSAKVNKVARKNVLFTQCYLEIWTIKTKITSRDIHC